VSAFLSRRLVLAVPTLIGVVLAVFTLMEIIPGDPASVFLGDNATEESIESLRHELGLDRPLPVRLSRYVVGLARGDLGTSIFQGEPVVELVLSRLPATLELAGAAFLIALLVGVGLGTAAALAQGRPLALVLSAIAQIGVAMPVFWLGILLMAWLAVDLRLLPAVGRGAPLLPAILSGDAAQVTDSLRHLVLPAVTLGTHHAAVISRLVRASLLDTLTEEYVRAARAKGSKELAILVQHALRNAVVPVISVLGTRLGALLGGAVLTEAVFGWPGLGQLAVSALSERDFPLVQGIVLGYALLFILLNIVVDVVHAGLDPRVRLNTGASRA